MDRVQLRYRVLGEWGCLHLAPSVASAASEGWSVVMHLPRDRLLGLLLADALSRDAARSAVCTLRARALPCPAPAAVVDTVARALRLAPGAVPTSALVPRVVAVGNVLAAANAPVGEVWFLWRGEAVSTDPSAKVVSAGTILGAQELARNWRGGRWKTGWVAAGGPASAGAVEAYVLGTEHLTALLPDRGRFPSHHTINTTEPANRQTNDLDAGGAAGKRGSMEGLSEQTSPGKQKTGWFQSKIQKLASSRASPQNKKPHVEILHEAGWLDGPAPPRAITQCVSDLRAVLQAEGNSSTVLGSISSIPPGNLPSW